MITIRNIELSDKELLEKSLQEDEFHKDTPVEFFYEPGTVCSVYSDEAGIVLFTRGKAVEVNNKRVIRLDIQFLDNYAARRNLKVMLAGFTRLLDNAKDNGFNAMVFESTHPLLRNFCIKRLGFAQVPDFHNWLVKYLDADTYIKAIGKASFGAGGSA